MNVRKSLRFSLNRTLNKLVVAQLVHSLPCSDNMWICIVRDFWLVLLELNFAMLGGYWSLLVLWAIPSQGFSFGRCHGVRLRKNALLYNSSVVSI